MDRFLQWLKKVQEKGLSPSPFSRDLKLIHARRHRSSYSWHNAHTNIFVFSPSNKVMRYPSSRLHNGSTGPNQCKIYPHAGYTKDCSYVSQHDDQLVKDYGVMLATDMIRRLTTEGDVPGVHFCTLNLEKSVSRVLERLRWTGVAASAQNKLIAVGLMLHSQPSRLTCRH